MEADLSELERELLNCVANSNAVFKSQQKGDPELTFEEKYKIALSTFKKSHCLFLSKFGHFMKKEHLKCFDKNDYEISYHINKLERYFNNSVHRQDVRNRRYEALKMLIEKGEYFSECEMMKRNPLLYEQLVGQYMTEDQKKARDSADVKVDSFVGIIMQSIDRDILKECQKQQQEEENNALEESDSDDTDDSSFKHKSSDDSCDNKVVLWGESKEPAKKMTDKKGQCKKDKYEISNAEQQMLRQEFVTNMYHSFLEGKDIDFDYSTVDENDSYDNVDLRTQDEQDRYFDSEPPETIPIENKHSQNNESEDELDAYMKSLKDEVSTNPNFFLDKNT